MKTKILAKILLKHLRYTYMYFVSLLILSYDNTHDIYRNNKISCTEKKKFINACLLCVLSTKKFILT